LDLPIIKIASSDVADWVLLEQIAKTKKPVIFSTGGASLKDMDDMVTFFSNRRIPLAINHCVSLYPSEDRDLQLNQIDFLRNRYPDITVGLSTHEHSDWHNSIMVAYAKGARTFERHIDIQTDDKPFMPYCSTPTQIDTWFKAWRKTMELCGQPGSERVQPADGEIKYLDALVRGVYARHDLPAGHSFAPEDYYLAVPLQKGQLSCRELINGLKLSKAISIDEALLVDATDSTYASTPTLRELIYNRGL
jgi:N-acetylneuraminate synthase